MMLHNRILGSVTLIMVSVLTLFTLFVCSSGYAEEIDLNYSGNYDNWDPENSPTVGTGLFPTLVIESNEETTPRIASESGLSGRVWVTISPFTATLSGLQTDLIAGYMSGDRIGVIITIAGKKASDFDFSDITSIKPDENGLFIWAVPAGQKNMDLFQVSIGSGASKVLSNSIRFSPGSEYPIIQPVVSPVSTLIQTRVQTQSPTPIPMVSGGPSRPALTHLTISARTTTPTVGEMLTISGRLTDQDGKGVSGATVTIDETGYPGAVQSEPFSTTQTGSDGSFEFSLGVSFANTVGLVANYEGDESHNPTESNTLLFTAHQA